MPQRVQYVILALAVLAGLGMLSAVISGESPTAQVNEHAAAREAAAAEQAAACEATRAATAVRRGYVTATGDSPPEVKLAEATSLRGGVGLIGLTSLLIVGFAGTLPRTSLFVSRSRRRVLHGALPAGHLTEA